MSQMCWLHVYITNECELPCMVQFLTQRLNYKTEINERKSINTYLKSNTYNLKDRLKCSPIKACRSTIVEKGGFIYLLFYFFLFPSTVTSYSEGVFFFFSFLCGDIIKGELYEKPDNFRVFISNH